MIAFPQRVSERNSAYPQSFPFAEGRPEPVGDTLEYVYHGAYQDAIYFAAKLGTSSSDVIFEISAAADYSDVIQSAAASTDSDGWVKASIGSLPPGVEYVYRVRVDGSVTSDREDMQAETLPNGSASFTFAAGSCVRDDSHGLYGSYPIFSLIESKNPLFFVHMGDIHYRDIASNDVADFRNGFEQMLDASRQHSLYRRHGFHYMWDDHDYGPNDTDRDNPSRPAATEAYRRYVPHKPLAFGDDPLNEENVAYAYTVGRIRFIVSDVRSERAPKGDTDDENKVVWAAAQDAWFRQECLDAKAAGLAICWVNTKPYIGDQTSGADHWGGYSTFREDLANFFQDNDLIERMFILSGDMHALAFDDGSNSNYATNPVGNGPPVCHAAPLAQRTISHKGGPYTSGPAPAVESNTRHEYYGLLTVTDNGGDTLSVQYSGRGADDSEVLGGTFTLAVEAETAETYTFSGSAAPSGTLVEVLDGSFVLASTVESGGTWSTSFDEDPAQLPASVTVRASADGFVTEEQTVNLDPAVNSYTGINFSLAEDTPGTVTRTGTVTRDGNTVAGADVVFITRADLLANATAQTTTDASGEYSAEIPTGEEMVGIALEGADGDSTPFTEGA